jgi:CRISPR-associated protein Cmr2
MNYLLAFHVGPIQDFIATARRTQDLWMGSWLLSRLSRIAIEKAQCKGADLVLPKVLPPDDDPAVADTPNHFIARYKEPNPEQMANAVEQAVRAEWSRIACTVKDVFFSAPPYRVDDALWGQQVNNFLEIYWALVPDNGSTAARNHAQAALDARKRLRDFIPTKEEHLKCTLCGVRQELSGQVGSDNSRKWWQGVVGKHLSRGHLLKLRVRENGNERLCAVCAVKRATVAAETAVPQLHKTNGSFPSTSSVAAAAFKKRLTELMGEGKVQDELRGHLQRLKDIGIPDNKIEKDCIPQLARLAQTIHSNEKTVCERLLTFDGDLFYQETFTTKRMKEEYPEAIEQLIRKLTQNWGVSEQEAERVLLDEEIAGGIATLRALYKAADIRPAKYFAALMMDGDHMGAFYGKMAERESRAMSGQMSQFARQQAKEIVEKHFGRLVYAGGDDVLALLPLEEALPCARELQEKFNEAVKDALEGVTLPEDVKRPTPSIGIAIAHHTQPLDATLNAMHHAEHDAKKHYDRDALCVYVLKRSGEEVHVGTRWSAGEDAVKVVIDLVGLLKQNALSMKFPTVFAGEARFLPLAAIGAELRRMGKRQSGEQFEQHKPAVKEWLGRAERLAAAIGAEEFAQWALLARFIASGGRDQE